MLSPILSSCEEATVQGDPSLPHPETVEPQFHTSAAQADASILHRQPPAYYQYTGFFNTDSSSRVAPVPTTHAPTAPGGEFARFGREDPWLVPTPVPSRALLDHGKSSAKDMSACHGRNAIVTCPQR